MQNTASNSPAYNKNVQTVQGKENAEKFKNVILRSMEIVLPSYNINQFKKHTLCFIIDDSLTISERKWVANISKKYLSTVFEDWKSALIAISSCSVMHSGEQNSSKIFIVTEKYEKQILRQLKLNPGLRVIVWNRQGDIAKYKSTKINFATSFTSQIDIYFNQHRGILLHNK